MSEVPLYRWSVPSIPMPHSPLLPDIEQWSQSSGSNVIPGRARPGLAGLRPHTERREGFTTATVFDNWKGFQVFLPESQGQNLALTVVYVPSSLDSALEIEDIHGKVHTRSVSSLPLLTEYSWL